jgi:hypothetical protein
MSVVLLTSVCTYYVYDILSLFHRNSKEDRQYNVQMKKDKRTNNNQQNITQKYKISFLLRIWTQICWSINMHVSHMSILLSDLSGLSVAALKVIQEPCGLNMISTFVYLYDTYMFMELYNVWPTGSDHLLLITNLSPLILVSSSIFNSNVTDSTNLPIAVGFTGQYEFSINNVIIIKSKVSFLRHRWLSCLGRLDLLLQRPLIYMTFRSFGFERSCFEGYSRTATYIG